MSKTKVFITGTTGYIGGDILYLLNEQHPDWQIACLVRDAAKASDLTSRYPRIRIVLGSLDSVQLIEQEAASANIVYHSANSDHVKSAQAIAQGLARNSATTVYWIHTSGAGILTHQNFSQNNFESACGDDKIYDDWEHISELTSLPDKALHRHVDKIVLGSSFGRKEHIKTAIVCPPAIYGLGRGTGNVHSVQVNLAVRLALQNKRALQMGDGQSIWHGVHIRDLSQLYLLLAEAAVSRSTKASWNDTGYYLAEDGAFTWGGITQAIANEAMKQGYLDTDTVQSVDFESAQRYHKNFPYLCGTTSRGVAKRARILLGWKPVQNRLVNELSAIVKDEAESLGLTSSKQGGKVHSETYDFFER